MYNQNEVINRTALFGCSGFLGQHLTRIYNGSKLFYRNDFDLKDNFYNINLENIKEAILAFGKTNLEWCESNKEEAYLVNVEKTKKFLFHLKKQNIKPIFISTDYVFDGKSGNYSEKSDVNPQTLYGQHKVMVEEFIINNFTQYLIIRSGKLLSNFLKTNNLINTIYTSGQKNKTIICAIDKYNSLAEASDFARGILSLQKIKANGIFHVCNHEKISRYEFCELAMEKFHFSQDLLKPVLTKDINPHLPLNTTMKNDKFVSYTNFVFTPLEKTIEVFLKCI